MGTWPCVGLRLPYRNALMHDIDFLSRYSAIYRHLIGPTSRIPHVDAQLERMCPWFKSPALNTHNVFVAVLTELGLDYSLNPHEHHAAQRNMSSNPKHPPTC